MVAKNPLNLETLHLEHGSHAPDSRYCVMEAAAYIAGEPWSDHPECVSSVITRFAVGLNDAWDDQQRQKLRPYIPKMLGTATNAADEKTRAWMLCDWLTRVYAPAWLDLVESCKADAIALRALPEMTAATIAELQRPVTLAKNNADAAWSAARAAAGDAAGDAARAAAWSAARAAAWSAAWDAAWSAARAAAGSAAGDAAWSAARAAAWDAAGDAAGSAARAALEPTVVTLQASALDLLDRLCAVGR